MSNSTTSAKKLLIIGASGMLGSMLKHVLQRYNPIGWTHTDLDITKADAVQERISKLKPDIIINAAAYTAVDNCEIHRDIAMLANATAPQHLAMTAKAIDATLIHFSTDYIFNGQEQEGYREDYNNIDPINVYGESKAAAEQAIQQLGDGSWNKYYIIRTAWLYGPNGKNFVDTMLQLSKDKPEIKVVNDQHGSPTYTQDLAEQVKYMIEQTVPFGIYHVTNNGTCTWYEFTQEIFKQAGATTKLIPCTSAEFPRPAKRPEYSILLNTKLPPLRSWQEGLKEYLNS